MKIRPLYIIVGIAMAASAMFLTSCGFMKVKYSFTGASIPEAAKTVSISYFPNNAPYVEPTLSSILTEAMQDKFARQTRLVRVDEGGDLSIEGEIIGYNATPSAVSGTDELSQRTKLTITVRVTFTNAFEPQWNFSNRTFSSYDEFDASISLIDAGSSVAPNIVDILVDEIFNAAVANW